MEDILKQKKIDRLYHFTRAENIKNILDFGLMPRAELDAWGIESFYNDEFRYDKCLNAVCTSIEHPNYRMFYRLRITHPEIDWVVIRLDASVLLNFECAYCWTNAGDATMYSTPIVQRKGISAFESLFKNREGYPTREELNIPSYYPTNPQAEVLVFDTIPIEYVSCLYFEDQRTYDKYMDITAQKVDTYVYPEVYRQRRDSAFWQTR